MPMKFDLTTFGETMIRISVRAGRTFANCSETDFHVGGTESNTAVALSRLGMKTSWVTRLPNNVLGRRIEADIARHGVDTSGVMWARSDRAGVYYVEFATLPRSVTALYDRRWSAMSKLKPEELDWNRLLNTRMLHLTGITPALSPSCRRATEQAIKRAVARKVPVSFDLNYRAKLWKPGTAARTLAPFLRGSTLAIMTREDAATVFKLDGDPEAVVKKIQKQLSPGIAVLTMGREGVLAWDGRELLYEAGRPVREIIDRVGAGDAFAAGLIFGFLKKNLRLGLKYGMFMSSMKMGMRGDMFWGTRKDVEDAIESQSREMQR
jgi:2-dehydro-3-deoxygluconokinase